MANVERTAYPLFPRALTVKDLQPTFTPRPEVLICAQEVARGAERRLALTVLLKSFQYLHYFPDVESIPTDTVEHIAATMGLPPQPKISYS